MELIDLIAQAKRKAKEAIDEASSCSDSEYQRLCRLDDDEAVMSLACQMLNEAAYNLEVGV